MRYRRWTAIILAFVLILCALVYVVAGSDSFRSLSFLKQKGFGLQFINLLLGGNLTALLCILLGIVLLVNNNGFENPLRIAFWGSGTVFLAIPTIVMSIGWRMEYLNHPYYSFNGTLLFIAGVVSTVCGIATCIYSIILYRYMLSGKLQQLAAGSPEKELKDLEYLKRTGLITVDEYEQIRQRFAEEMKTDN